jgi:uncharacterized protein
MSAGPHPPRRPSDLMTAGMIRQLKLGPRRNKVTVERRVRVPMRDGTILLADHYAPVVAQERPTVLMRCPYGRGWQFAMTARPFAEFGYHVLLQSTRGTFGSGGAFTPGTNEADDGQDTVAWLRTQDWFNGQLATVGASYLAFTAWAIAMEPPPELFAMAVHISPHDLAAAGFGRGPFELYNLLMWSDLMAHQEVYGSARMTWRTMTAERRLAPAMSRLPLATTGATIGGDGAPWFSEWLAHPDPADPYWAGYSAAAALDRVTVPTLLISGFHDFFVEQTLQQYRALRRRGVQAGLTIGPWNHMTLDMGLAVRETIAWLDAFSSGNGEAPPSRPTAVRAWTSGTGRWHELGEWPPPGAAAQPWYLQPGGRLADTPAAAGSAAAAAAGGAAPAAAGCAPATADAAEPSVLRYDPADPTPSVGGRVMSLRGGGSLDNTALEARPDVLTFSTAPLEHPVQVAGAPEVRLHLSSDSAYHDIFVRLCDVDPRGRSRNLTDQIYRSAAGEVTPGRARELVIPMTDVWHVFLPGHRIRLQVSGGAFPRFARSLGTAADPITGTQAAVVTHRVLHDPRHQSALVLPVLAAAPAAGASAATTSAAGAQAAS